MIAREIQVGDKIRMATGVVKVEKNEHPHHGIEATVASVGKSGRRVLWFWPQQAVDVVRSRRRTAQEVTA